MDGLASLLIVVGAFTASLAGLGFWAWRRLVPRSVPAVAETQTVALHRNGNGGSRADGALASGEAAWVATPEEVALPPEMPEESPMSEPLGPVGGHVHEQGAEVREQPAAPVRSRVDATPPQAASEAEAANPLHEEKTAEVEWGATAPAEPAPAEDIAGEKAGQPAAAAPEIGLPEPEEAAGPIDKSKNALGGSDSDEAWAEAPLNVALEDVAPPPMARDLASESDRPVGYVLAIPDAKPPEVTQEAVGDDSGSGGDETVPQPEPSSRRPPEDVRGERDDDADASAAVDASGVTPEAEENVPQEPPRLRSPQPAIHRDRRGTRRPVGPADVPVVPPAPVAGGSSRLPAEAWLRLSLHPIGRTAKLSLVLARPEGFPDCVTVTIRGQRTIEAYDAQRYDDLDLSWTAELLVGELRVDSAEGLQWVRSGRQVQIFAEDPSEPDLLSVGAARAGARHAIICRCEDAPAVCAIATSAGSPELTPHERWEGIPSGWAVLSGYRPIRAASPVPEPALRPLDPGSGIAIKLTGGLAIRPKVFAEGHPPRIVVDALPDSISVSIGGRPAFQGAGGGWEAPAWDTPGQHIIDVVPGPSLTYEVTADPARTDGWPFWNAHEERFGRGSASPWARAQICGAAVRGPAGEAVVAVETQPILIALGARSGAVVLQRRGDAPVSLALVPEPTTYLFSARGQRRSQGSVIWLGLAGEQATQGSRRNDPDWAAVVRTAASRRLALRGADTAGEDAWRKAKERAHRLRRPRR